MPNGMTKEQQDLMNRIFTLVERAIAAYEVDVSTRRMKFHAEHPMQVPSNLVGQTTSPYCARVERGRGRRR